MGLRWSGRLPLRVRVLLIQLGIVALVVGVVSLAHLAILARVVERQSAERVLGIGHAVAQMDEVRDAFDSPYPPALIQPVAEGIRAATGVSFVVVWNKDRIRYSHPDPARIGQELSTDNQPALDGRAYTAVERGTLGVSVRAKVPIYRDGQLIGGVSVGILVEQLQGLLQSYWPQLVAVAFGALGAGALCSHVLSSHIKRQIFGLEPEEIATLLQQREALLHGIREGVLAIDRNGVVTVANDEARRLLDLPDDVEGRNVRSVLPHSELPSVMETGQPQRDVLTLGHNGRPIVVNRMPVRLRGQIIGAVSTFRDQTEVQQLARELTGTRSHLDALRAQAHEFANKLHTIGGLLELGFKDQAVELITQTTKRQQTLVDDLTRRIADPSLSALLLGKASVAAERGIDFQLASDSRLRSSTGHEQELLTVVGNLIDNAFDATEGRSERWVRISISDRRNEVRIAVADSGPGVPRTLRGRIFERGFSTKGAPGATGHRGVGLALVQQAVRRIGGEVTVRGESRAAGKTAGAIFIVRLPVSARAAERAQKHVAPASGPPPSGVPAAPARVA
jgi:two-component system CitB family sensor kinase